MKKSFLPLLAFSLFCVILYGFFKSNEEDIRSEIKTKPALSETLEEEIKDKKVVLTPKPGKTIKGKIKSGETLSGILGNQGVSNVEIHRLVEKSKKIYSPRKINAGKEYSLILDPQGNLDQFIYHKNAIEYVVYNLKDSLHISLKTHPVDTLERTIQGQISNSLSQSMMENGASPALVDKLAEIYAWQIDFHHIQKGDGFKVIYEEFFVEDKSVGIGKIIASEFKHRKEDFYAFYFEQEDGTKYFDEKGNSLKKAFLKAPLKFSRISSRYTKKRYHPVQKRYKAHLGTDYAAPRGTAIRAVGDGVVVASTYNRFNGNYVKIKHNSIYTTQYLHMSKRKKGLQAGKRVKQGQIIGYVGSTGLASGPHLCFRFWKNGKQVDALRVKLPPSKPIKSTNRLAFNKVKLELSDKLNKINSPE